MNRLPVPCHLLGGWAHRMLWRALALVLLLSGLGCSRRTSSASSPADPANPQAPSAPMQKAGLLKQGVYTGAELIGEPHGRPAMGGQGNLGHGQMPGMEMSPPGSGKDTREKTAPQGKQGPAQVRYTCPMHPQVVEDHPGKCPICGMDLIPREPAAQPKGGIRP